MACLDGASGKYRNFRKDDFEADWIKVAECRFSQVYRVKLKLWREQCALKKIDPSLSANSPYRSSTDEVSVIAKVKFKYLVSIYGLCSEPSAMVMEYMSNGSLDNLLASHTLMWPKKFQMIHEVTMGMNFLHSLKPPLLHLNLKTSNVLLDDHLHVKISDFGLITWAEGFKTKFMEHLTARGNISYVPPETFTQCPKPPGTSFDVYSFSIVMWEILTQQKPYSGSSVTKVLIQVSAGKRPNVEMISDDKPDECVQLISIMQQCWDLDHKKRPPFSDTVKTTEALSEVIKTPGGNQPQRDGNQEKKMDYPWLVSPAQKFAVPEMPDLPSDAQHGKDGILFLLSKKDFGNFRKSVKSEHTAVLFSDNNSLLHYTVASGDVESVQHVLSLGANVNCPSTRGYTPLIVAVVHRLHDIIFLLLKHGADASQGDKDQWTSLHFACQIGDDRTVRMLLDRGAVVDAKEKAGWTSLHLACQNGHESVVRLLLSRLSEEVVGIREEVQGRTPFHLACAYGHVSIAKLLLSKGADPNITDCSLCTALHLSAEQGHNRVVRQLMKNGAQIDCVDSRGYTPLHLAALKGHTGICRQLLSCGASPNPRTLQGWTPIHLSAFRGHQDTVLQLESQAGCVNAKGENGWTPLHLACHHSQQEVVAKLLAAKADPNVTEEGGGWTPLHLACNNVSFQSVLQLISHHADVNAVNWGKATPLHLAAQHGCIPIIKALLLNGADKTLIDSSGATALNVAQMSKQGEVVELLA
ncbi:ankyrin repeat and protein kinase domain-containing protein 1 [Lampris incognitus]|uniref:ankyrin repeat and protein kinase domain-containing protein 1 n=1 Tax=Lampris incognitus TaxID=2546036 RepID=UPI0024B62647|nr:ankyrin repeat and protein kinase domain-containing protein 1 [Lampris incognitus]